MESVRPGFESPGCLEKVIETHWAVDSSSVWEGRCLRFRYFFFFFFRKKRFEVREIMHKIQCLTHDRYLLTGGCWKAKARKKAEPGIKPEWLQSPCLVLSRMLVGGLAPEATWGTITEKTEAWSATNNAFLFVYWWSNFLLFISLVVQWMLNRNIQ